MEKLSDLGWVGEKMVYAVHNDYLDALTTLSDRKFSQSMFTKMMAA
jgi:hypothetical protein